MVEKIILKIGDRSIEVTLEEAKELKKTLEELFVAIPTHTPYIPYIPYIPYNQPYWTASQSEFTTTSTN